MTEQNAKNQNNQDLTLLYQQLNHNQFTYIQNNRDNHHDHGNDNDNGLHQENLNRSNATKLPHTVLLWTKWRSGSTFLGAVLSLAAGIPFYR